MKVLNSNLNLTPYQPPPIPRSRSPHLRLKSKVSSSLFKVPSPKFQVLSSRFRVSGSEGLGFLVFGSRFTVPLPAPKVLDIEKREGQGGVLQK